MYKNTSENKRTFNSVKVAKSHLLLTDDVFGHPSNACLRIISNIHEIVIE